MQAADYEKLGVFFLGKEKDSEKPLLYDSKHLTTHAVCVGMTGSGKTGLCISLLEEAAIDRIPAIVIDPKGDLGNLLLTFPELRPEDFRPWINEDEARNKGLTPEEFAAKQAETWRNGLAKWGQAPERIQKLKDSVDFTIYTPGSEAGVPLSILHSFDAPDAKAMGDREALRDRIEGTVSSLLGLIGVEADPVQSREHVLLSSILDHAWRNGENLDLAGLIGRVQTPPFQKVGVLGLDQFYPEKDRFGLAMALNNLLASPGFEAWMHGEPLDVQRLLYTEKGDPRMAILSIAHLNDAERMFFVSLLLNQVLGWVRGQSGTSSLRAILYMDEIFGYFPPVANPPSKKPLLTLLKQARAFGVGVVLATQNPVDLDYKGLANTGTWLIGRLQTERDKQRVLEGLEGAAVAQGGRFDKAAMEQTLAGLGNRVFLMNNVHRDQPVLFESRWALSYLRGPMARTDIQKLMEGREKSAAPAAAAEAVAAAPVREAKASAPPLIPGVPQYFLPGSGEIEYDPHVLGAADVRFTDTKLKVDETRRVIVLAPITDDGLATEFDNAEAWDGSLDELERAPADGARFAEVPGEATKAKQYAAWQKGFVAWLQTKQSLELYRSTATGILSRPGESEEQFRIRVTQAGREARDAAKAKLEAKYAPKVAGLEERRRRALQAVEKEQQQASDAKMQSMISIGTNILGALFSTKKVSSANMGRIGTAARQMGRATKESSDVGRAQENLAAIDEQLTALNDELAGEIAALEASSAVAMDLETVVMKPKKTGIQVQAVALGWVPR